MANDGRCSDASASLLNMVNVDIPTFPRMANQALYYPGSAAGQRLLACDVKVEFPSMLSHFLPTTC